jgi:hypothetical protein
MLEEGFMFRFLFSAAAIGSSLSALAAPAPAATTYQTVTMSVPVSIDSMPIGTTASVACYTPTVGAATSYAQVPIPVQTLNGFVVYHGAPIVVTLKNGQGGPPGSSGLSLVSGASIGCEIDWSPSSPTDPAKSTYKTFSVQLQ